MIPEGDRFTERWRKWWQDRCEVPIHDRQRSRKFVSCAGFKHADFSARTCGFHGMAQSGHGNYADDWIFIFPGPCTYSCSRPPDGSSSTIRFETAIQVRLPPQNYVRARSEAATVAGCSQRAPCSFRRTRFGRKQRRSCRRACSEANRLVAAPRRILERPDAGIA